MLALYTVAALASSALVARADPVPSAPGPGDVFTVGKPCTIEWTPDTTGVWKTMNIELMTGSNLGMVHLTTVATVDGTDPATTTFSYTCPEVTPNSAIYFYQFTSPGTAAVTTVPETMWTTRFTIAAADGTTTPPTEANQPSNPSPAIPWGTGALADPSTAVAAPAAPGAASSASASGSATGASSSTTAGASSISPVVVTSTSTSVSRSSTSVSATPSSRSVTRNVAPTTTGSSSPSTSSGAADQANSAIGSASGSRALVALAGLVAFFL